MTGSRAELDAGYWIRGKNLAMQPTNVIAWRRAYEETRPMRRRVARTSSKGCQGTGAVRQRRELTRGCLRIQTSEATATRERLTFFKCVCVCALVCVGVRVPSGTCVIAANRSVPMSCFACVDFLRCRCKSSNELTLPGWNVFDTLLVVASLVDTFSSTSGVTLSYVRVLRVMRLTKTLRVIRLLRFASFVRHLRLMLIAIMECAVPLLWAVVLLFFLMFVFSVIFMQGVTNFIREAGPNDVIVERLLVYFNGLTMTLLTLFMSISGGVSWGEVVQLLLEISDLFGVLFVLYVATMVLALLNIVTGIFVNEAVAMAQMDQALMREQDAWGTE